MKRNMGTLDRLLRIFVVAPVAIILGVVVFQFGSLFSIIALLVAAIMLGSSALGFCATYTLFGISTVGHRGERPPEARTAPQY